MPRPCQFPRVHGIRELLCFPSPLQMGHHMNTAVKQLKVDKQLSGEAVGQAQTHTQEIIKEIRAYAGGISRGTDREVRRGHVVVVVVVWR